MANQQQIKSRDMAKDERTGVTMAMLESSAPALLEGTVKKVVLKFSGIDCFLVVSRWNPEEARQEVCFVGGVDLYSTLEKFRTMALARELQWKVDRFS